MNYIIYIKNYIKIIILIYLISTSSVMVIILAFQASDPSSILG